jgi:hypothetical protein
MKTAFVLGLALALGLLLAPSPAAAFDPRQQGVLRTPVDPWAHWPPRQHSHRFHGHKFGGFDGHKFHRSGSTVIVVPGKVTAPQFVWVPAQWAWTGFHWVWVPGHWQRLAHH